MRARRLRWLVALVVLCAVAAAPAIWRRIRDAHPQAITHFLARIEKEYRDGSPWGGSEHAREMIEYVKHHYPYETMDGHKDTLAAKELAKQRQQTIETIEAWLDRQRRIGVQASE